MCGTVLQKYVNQVPADGNGREKGFHGTLVMKLKEKELGNENWKGKRKRRIEECLWRENRGDQEQGESSTIEKVHGTRQLPDV